MFVFTYAGFQGPVVERFGNERELLAFSAGWTGARAEEGVGATLLIVRTQDRGFEVRA